jgi:hypothetical protein
MTFFIFALFTYGSPDFKVLKICPLIPLTCSSLNYSIDNLTSVVSPRLGVFNNQYSIQFSIHINNYAYVQEIQDMGENKM